MAFEDKKFVGADALSELSTKVKTELDKKTNKAGSLTNVSYDTTNKKFTKTTQGAHDPVTTDIVSTSTLKTDMGIADFDGTFSSLKSKPTTISGYGITDAKVQNSTVTIGSNSVTALTQDDVSSTYDSSGTSPVDGKAVAAALGTLDVESVGGAGKYISAISETDGKISATAETMDSTPTSNSTKAVTSDGIYEYVNSSVATNTAYFIGTFDSVEELEAYSGIITNNDYAFVTSTDSSGNTLYNRYKYNESTHTWSFEYALNNSSFTSAQWATIQSGLTSSDKTKLDGIQSGANKTIVDAAMSSSSTNPVQNKVVNTALAGKQDTLTFDSTPTQSSTNPVTSAGIYTDQARQDALEVQDRAALIEVVDNGAKNLLKNELGSGTKSGIAYTTGTDGSIVITAGTATRGNADFVIPFTPKESGQYVLQGCPSGGSGATYKGQIVLYPSMINVAEIFDNTSVTATLTGGTQYAYRFRVYNGKAISDSTIYPMVCSKAAWDVSHQYEPYAPTNMELYEDKATVDDIMGLGTPIASNTDLDTITQPGTYHCVSSSIAQTLLHSPVSQSFRMLVMYTNTSAHYDQIIFTRDAAIIYRRSELGSGFSDWAKFSATLDEIPTANSTNAVMSDGVWADQQRQDAEIAVIANAGAKNLAPIETGTNKTDNKWIVGVKSENTEPINLIAGDYIFTAVSSSTGSGQCQIKLAYSDGTTALTKVFNFGSTMTLTFTASKDVVGYGIYSNPAPVTFEKMMIRSAAITDPTFQPYALPNPTLTPAAIKAVDEGSKNIADMSKTSFTLTSKDGVQVSLSGDTLTSVGTGGTLTNNFFNIFYEPNTLLIPAGTWVASLHGTGTVNFRIEEFDDVNGTALKGEFGEPFTFTIPKNATLSYIRITSKPSTNCAGTFKLMICTAADWAVSQKFVPYAPTNRELYSGELQYEVFDIVDNLNTTFVDKTNSRFKIYKYGRFCFADVSLKLNTNNLTGNDTITSTALPEKIRPKFDFYGVVVARDNGIWALANMLSVPFVVEATNGSVLLRTGAEHSSALYITATAVWPASNTAAVI